MRSVPLPIAMAFAACIAPACADAHPRGTAVPPVRVAAAGAAISQRRSAVAPAPTKAAPPAACLTTDKSRGGPRVRLERQVAERIVAQVQRICRDLRDKEAAGPGEPGSARMAALRTFLGREVLAPIEREYPDLQPREPSPAAPKALAKDALTPPAVRQIGPATALHLRWALGVADKRIIALSKASCVKAASETCFRAYEDLLADISVAQAPVYRNYPALWQEELRQTMRNAEGRSAKSDASFRESAPPAGSVRLTHSALEAVEAYGASFGGIGAGCQMTAFSWFAKERYKRPGDTTWTDTGPGLGLGSFACHQVPPDVVRTIGGMRMIFSGDKASRFAGKTIDRRDGKFVIEDR